VAQNTTETVPGDCLSELSKYDWDYNEAKSIMIVESGNNPLIKNDDPSTGDYSIGCFQVNLRGDLAQSRPSEEWLRDPKNNTEWAYEHYISQGRTFCSTGGWFNSCKKVGLN